MELLKDRFLANMQRHPGTGWEEVQQALSKNVSAMESLAWMEETGGMPDVIFVSDQEIVIADCSEEEPAGRRNLCYDMQARVSHKNNAPADSALEQAQRHGVSLMDEQAYRRLQSLGDFDLKTSCWLSTPETIRAKGGALFGEKRYGQVFIYHNGVQPYYQVRGFRCLLRIRK